MTEANSTKEETKLVGRVALVTGAGKRLGRAVALHLAEQGAHVAVHYRKSEEEAREVVKTIRDAGGRAESFAGELTSVQDIRRMVHEVGHEMGRLDILVNSAANFLPSSVISTTEEVWDAALDTNLKAAFFVAQAAAPLLRRTRGVIVNFADTSAISGWPGYIAHTVSKAGMVSLTRVLAKALGPEVRVNAIAPGTITLPGDPPEWEADFVKAAVLKRTGTPQDVAEAVEYLALAEFLTGQVLVLDGGKTLL
jgi:NAD(P)-dependent dehydrogenase (short-subunit alcohol dehydrogenase family)